MLLASGSVLVVEDIIYLGKRGNSCEIIGKYMMQCSI